MEALIKKAVQGYNVKMVPQPQGKLRVEILSRGYVFMEPIKKKITKIVNNFGWEVIAFDNFEKDIEADRVWWACVRLKRK